MRVLVAGASGVVGKALVPALLARGHTVAGIVRKSASAEFLARLGATPIVADALDRPAMMACVADFGPEIVTHQLTALPATTDLRKFARLFEQTNRLRTEGLDNLMNAARASGVRRFVSQSFCGWPYARDGGLVKTENDPLDPDPPPAFRSTLAALRHVEEITLGSAPIHGIALRYGGFYGPGTFISRDGAVVEQVRRRRFPIVGTGGGIWSFLHVDDLASASVAAIEGDATGIFNVVDDDPAALNTWLPGLARALNAAPPRRIPAILGRLVLPRHLFLMMTEMRGGSNAKFKRVFGWQPKYRSWRDGFEGGL